MENDSISMSITPVEPIRIIILLMIKNEGKIIERCIRSTLSLADAICVCDTGSTDNTLEVLETLKENFKKEGIDIPFKIYHYDWLNFGHNRTLSFKSARDMATVLGYELSKTYALLLDADMLLCNLSLCVSSLNQDGYKIKQKNGFTEYYNVRLVKLSEKWFCKGKTHEVWIQDKERADSISLDASIIYIDDKNDGGCKSDKYERDKRLLLSELEEDPMNSRAVFYLAQTYKCMGDIGNAILWYKQRLEMGGFYEEIFYSMYMICKLYIEKNDIIEAEYWGQKAYKMFPNRSETLYELAKYHRLNRNYYKSYHYIQQGISIPIPSVLLFLDTSIYQYLFKYEETIVKYYIGKITDGLNCILHYLKDHDKYQMNVYSNMEYYMRNFKDTFNSIPIKTGSLLVGADGDFHPSSTSLISHQGELIANIRFVNYDIVDGRYIMMCDGVKSSGHPVKTINKCATLESDLSIRTLKDMHPVDITTYPHNIQGMEDVRLFCFDNETIHYLASSKDVSPEGNIVIVKGKYDIDTNHMTHNTIIQSPYKERCEKNWIMLDTDVIVYKWNPFTIAQIRGDSLEIIQTTEVKGILRHMRGSTGFIKTSPNTYVGIIHSIINTPRKYYHMFVEIKRETVDSGTHYYKISRYSLPFYFETFKVEYCIGFVKIGGICSIIYSRNDNNPAWIQFNSSDMEQLFKNGITL